MDCLLLRKERITRLYLRTMLNLLRQWFGSRTFGAVRSPQWSQVRRKFISTYPYCAVCGKKGTLLKANEVHHCVPFHVKPSLELLESNLITLCRQDHYTFGHLNSWSSFNVSVREDAKIWNDKITNRP